nr:RusA family crossover junction endodeoxyribonuclease [Escherichia coli]
MAAVCYINETGTVNRNGGKPWGWPWDASWWKPNARRRDLDNLQKAAFDALTKSGFWLDDQQVDYYSVKRMPVVKGGRLELTITELESA